MILVDTSVWIHHLRTGSAMLRSMLYDNKVLCHPFVIGEVACGYLRNRSTILRLMASLPQAIVVDHHEVLYFLESRKLYGRGLGWIDLHLLASAILSSATIWTLDRILGRAASDLLISEARVLKFQG